MRLLLDESVPQDLKEYLPGHDVRTVKELGWQGKSNGELLGLASEVRCFHYRRSEARAPAEPGQV